MACASHHKTLKLACCFSCSTSATRSDRGGRRVRHLAGGVWAAGRGRGRGGRGAGAGAAACRRAARQRQLDPALAHPAGGLGAVASGPGLQCVCWSARWAAASAPDCSAMPRCNLPTSHPARDRSPLSPACWRISVSSLRCTVGRCVCVCDVGKGAKGQEGESGARDRGAAQTG